MCSEKFHSNKTKMPQFQDTSISISSSHISFQRIFIVIWLNVELAVTTVIQLLSKHYDSCSRGCEKSVTLWGDGLCAIVVFILLW